jgi:hypothetical protein
MIAITLSGLAILISGSILASAARRNNKPSPPVSVGPWTVVDPRWEG